MRAILFSLAILTVGPLKAESGTLFIVGGGLSSDNAEIYRAFIESTKGGSIAIIPSASAKPQASHDAFAANLVRYGVELSRIVQVKLAEVDDPETPVDESTWAVNGSNAEEIAKVQAASAIWFTGGDQARTVRLLGTAPDDSPMLAAIWRRLTSGAVIGGISAGAAIMGDVMILCGDPARAMTDPVSFAATDCTATEGAAELLVLANGLGFLPLHVVDQHFSERGRLPRLVRAVACGPAPGIGIDEDTALVLDRENWGAKVIGKGSVTTVERPALSDCKRRRTLPMSIRQYGTGDTIQDLMTEIFK